MSDKINLSTFPANKTEALAFLYLQSQDLSDLAPEQIYDKYEEAYTKIHKYCAGKKNPSKIISSPI